MHLEFVSTCWLVKTLVAVSEKRDLYLIFYLFIGGFGRRTRRVRGILFPTLILLFLFTPLILGTRRISWSTLTLVGPLVFSRRSGSSPSTSTRMFIVATVIIWSRAALNSSGLFRAWTPGSTSRARTSGFLSFHVIQDGLLESCVHLAEYIQNVLNSGFHFFLFKEKN